MTWGMSRVFRISLLLVIDFIFFLVELIVGHVVDSLALVADSFHMLNDVLSLAVALYAIKLAGQRIKDEDTKYSYGWHRAEILAALINGVFLLALCFSIVLEAIERFSSTPEISNPKLVVIVGSLGLASNLFGLFLFHEHDHSHGHKGQHHHEKAAARPTHERDEQSDSMALSGSVMPTDENERGRNRERSDSLFGHPAVTRAYVVHQAQELQRAHSPSARRSAEDGIPPSYKPERSNDFFGAENRQIELDIAGRNTSEPTPPLGGDDIISARQSATDLRAVDQQISASAGPRHVNGQAGSMNMRALVLHVMGDALGNIGVISTGLIIWFVNLSWKYYLDPAISLVITCIIFSSALPLVKSASFILLQGVPSGISLKDVDGAIRIVEGVQDVHELHIWQLSESKVVASVHVLASRNHDFMQVATDIRKALHDRGIHSSTIQPEYHPWRQAQAVGVTNDTSCLVMCPPNQNCNPSEHACCPPPPPTV
ncbi:ZRC1_1 [Sanghuangporus weigelae]